jgi:C-terminal processing protease CtpA/Prc
MKNRRLARLVLSMFFLCAVLATGCMKEEFGGVGIEVPAGTDKVGKTNPFIVVSVFKGGTGDAAGLKENDLIEKVDAVPLAGLTQEYIVKNLLRGKVGSFVTLEIVRDVNGSKTNMVFRIPRGNIMIQK